VLTRSWTGVPNKVAGECIYIALLQLSCVVTFWSSNISLSSLNEHNRKVSLLLFPIGYSQLTRTSKLASRLIL